jgi:hypothetical protein
MLDGGLDCSESQATLRPACWPRASYSPTTRPQYHQQAPCSRGYQRTCSVPSAHSPSAHSHSHSRSAHSHSHSCSAHSLSAHSHSRSHPAHPPSAHSPLSQREGERLTLPLPNHTLLTLTLTLLLPLTLALLTLTLREAVPEQRMVLPLVSSHRTQHSLACVLCPMSCVLCPMSYVLCPIPCVLCPMSCVLCPVYYVLCPMLCRNPNSVLLCLLPTRLAPPAVSQAQRSGCNQPQQPRERLRLASQYVPPQYTPSPDFLAERYSAKNSKPDKR